MPVTVRKRLLAAVAFLAALGGAAPCRADIFALAVGINDYQYLPRLEGAALDAEDIAGVLRRIGVRQVTLLQNREATHARIKREWKAMVARARAGDTLIFTYAGHGSQEPEKVAGSEEDGKDETFLLSGFNRDWRSPGFSERIVDNEINAWFKAAEEKKLRVIFVADSCHSGTMTRSADSRIGQSVRAVPPYVLGDLQISDDLVQSAFITSRDLPHVMFFSATFDERTVPEILIEGQMRGALSYAFARALEREADRNLDGVITRFELEGYIRPAVRQLSEAKQIPNIVYGDRDAGDVPLLTNIRTQGPKQVEMTTATLRLGFLNLVAGRAERLGSSIAGVRIAPEGRPADLIWDAGDRVVLNGLGDAVAQDVGPAQLQGVVDKWRILPVLKRMVMARPLSLSLIPDDSRHRAGQEITFTSESLSYPNVTVLDLAPDGSVFFLYPLRNDRMIWQAGMRYRLALKVIPPFGADHLLVISSAKPLMSLHSRLPHANATELPGLLAKALKGVDHQIGLQALYTAKGREG